MILSTSIEITRHRLQERKPSHAQRSATPGGQVFEVNPPNRAEGMAMANKHMVYRSPHATAWLTTDSAASSYGKPVLRCIVKGQRLVDYGPDDVLPSGLTARALVLSVLPKLKGGKLAMAEAFLAGGPPA